MREHARERDGVFHRELGSRADAEVRGVRGVADQHDIFVDAISRTARGRISARRPSPARCFAFEISALPSRRSANSFSQSAIDSSCSILSMPAFSQFVSGVSTMNVDQSASKR